MPNGPVMRDTAYLIFNRGGIKRMVKRLPTSLGRNEYAILVKLEVPQSMFQHRPFEANLKIESNQLLTADTPALSALPVR